MHIALIILAILIYAIVEAYKHFRKPIGPDKLEQAHRSIGELETQLKLSKASNIEIADVCTKMRGEFEKLRHQKISADVKMGQKSENLLPFLQSFPYRDEEIRGLFNPLDLIVFTETEVIFVEVKTGAAQLSDKQRRIRDNIKAGRVRFEIHRMNEKGVSVK